MVVTRDNSVELLQLVNVRLTCVSQQCYVAIPISANCVLMYMKVTYSNANTVCNLNPEFCE